MAFFATDSRYAHQSGPIPSLSFCFLRSCSVHIGCHCFALEPHHSESMRQETVFLTNWTSTIFLVFCEEKNEFSCGDLSESWAA